MCKVTKCQSITYEIEKFYRNGITSSKTNTEKKLFNEFD